MTKSSNPVIICAALTGAVTRKNNNPSVPYTLKEFAEEAYKCRQAGAAMVHVHARNDDGENALDVDRIKAVHDAIKEKCHDLIICLSSALASPPATPEQRIGQIIAIKPEVASLNTNTMNFGFIDRHTGQILADGIFVNTFTMLQEFGKHMEANDVKPEIECYDMGGLDNTMLIAKQGFFSEPMNFNFVWGVGGGQRFRPEAMIAMKNALPPNANFTTCGVGPDQFPCTMMSCFLGGHIRVGVEDNTRMPNGETAKGSYEQVEWAVKVGISLNRNPATPDEARHIMGIKKR